MALDQPNPGDFISFSSSEDEAPPPPKKKRARETSGEPSGEPSSNGSQSRKKRAKASSSGNISEAPGSEEGEIDETEVVSKASEKGQTSNGDVAAQSLTASSSVFIPPQPPIYSQESLSFMLPAFTQKREGSWLERFQDWVQIFYNSNSTHASAINAELLLAAYAYYIDEISKLKSGKKRQAKQASKAFNEAGDLAKILNSFQSQGAVVAVVQPKGDSAVAANQTETPTSQGKADKPSSTGNSQQPVADQLDQSNEAKPTMNGSVVTSHSDEAAGNASVTLPEHETQSKTEEAAPMNQTKPPKEGIPTGEEELRQQRRYFPSARDPSTMCLLCGADGHKAAGCTKVCKFCGKDDHWDYICPTIKPRCTKCRQLGHNSSDCVEKLVLTKEDGLACAYCNSGDHLEDQCTDVWRSFHPDAHNMKKVVALTISCSMCGSGQHFSAECPERPPHIAPNPTWSMANYARYVDPSCGILAIEKTSGRGGMAKPGRQPDIRIRGRATHVHYSESEDSDTEFLGRRAPNQQFRPGQIRMSSNIQMPGNMAQPPLPPGPPPPGAPSQPRSHGNRGAPGASGYGSSRPLGPPPSLPAKPPAPARDYRNVPPPQQESFSQSNNRGRGGEQGSRGGRGGGRGGGSRGRGRGRGRGK